MNDHIFIHENSNFHKLKVLLFTLFILLAIIAIAITFRKPLYDTAQKTSIAQSLISLTKFQLKEVTPAGLFYTGLIGGLFFVFVPLEVLFYSTVLRGGEPYLSVFLMVTGFCLAQIVNYAIGAKLSPVIMHLVSKKKVYKARRFINKYGAWGIFLSNLSPFPSEILTFALGLTRYNVYRLFILTIIGSTIKYSAIALIALYFN